MPALPARLTLPLIDVVAVGELWPALEVTLTGEHQTGPNPYWHECHAVLPNLLGKL